MQDLLKTLIKKFMPFAQERMGFKRPPRLFLRQDAKNASNPLGKTAFYDPQAKSVTLYISNRHPKDIMRSLSHELVHHKQNCNGQFDNVSEMGEGYAQNNEHLRGMEREAYEVGNLCFRDWEDSIKGTIYNEHLLKGVNNTMSTKTWKNKELTTLLSEAWGFGFNLDNLNEGELKGGLKDYMEKKRGESSDDDDDGDEDEESVEEGKDLSAMGGGPTNKAGKIERSDVANKDTSKFGQGGSKGGGKESAGGSVAAPKAGKIDRTVVSNKASGRWLKEGEEGEEEETLDEMCPAEDHDMGEMEMTVASPESRAVELVDELKELIMQLQGGEVPGNRGMYQENEEEDELEERKGRGREGQHTRTPDPRLREEKIRQIIRKSLKNIKERKKNG